MEQQDVNQTIIDVDLENLTFNELPKAISWLITKTLEIERKLETMPVSVKAKKKATEDVNMWFNVKELSDYLPTHPAVQTIYGWTCNKAIPYHKKGKRTFFLKNEIDKWISDEKYETEEEMEEMAKAFIMEKKKKEAYVR